MYVVLWPLASVLVSTLPAASKLALVGGAGVGADLAIQVAQAVVVVRGDEGPRIGDLGELIQAVVGVRGGARACAAGHGDGGVEHARQPV